MRVLYCHNRYQQPGGEDNCANDEVALLESRGHFVHRYTRHNDDIRAMGRLAVAAKTIWNRQTYREASDLMREHRLDVMHCMNTFPLISPSIYYAARKQGVAVVQSLQNFRLFCPGGYLMRDHRVCLDCLEKFIPWPSVRHACYRESRAATAVLATMLVTHRVLGTWKRVVNRYCACSFVARDTFARGGLPAEKIAVKPNFIDPAPEIGPGDGRYFLFVGRLSPEKGLTPLLEAWQSLAEPLPLKIAGDGPLRKTVDAAATKCPAIEVLGWKKPAEVAELMGRASALVLPSLWYEGFPKTLLESLAKGTPILASNLGSMSETIRPGENGLLFQPGSAPEIRQVVEEFLRRESEWPAFRERCRHDYLSRYTADHNYAQLMEIYRQAIEDRKAVG